MTRSSPTWRGSLDRVVDDVPSSRSGGAPADVVEEVLEHLLAVGRVDHLGVELHAVELRSACSSAATGASGVAAVTGSPRGR